MTEAATISGGFAEAGGGSWLAGHGQPAAFSGSLARRRRKGWIVRDRGSLCLVEATGRIYCSDSARPFLTHIPCAAPITAVSSKVLLAPAAARSGADTVKVIPMSLQRAICTTSFASDWVVMATSSRVARIKVDDGGTLAVRPEAAVAWTGGRPTGFCPKLRLVDMLLPGGPKELLLNFHGPCVVWVEGAGAPRACAAGRAMMQRRAC